MTSAILASVKKQQEWKRFCDARHETNAEKALLQLAHFVPLTDNKTFSNLFKANPSLRAKFLETNEGMSNLLQRCFANFSELGPSWKKALHARAVSERPLEITLRNILVRNATLGALFLKLPNLASLRFENCLFEPHAKDFVQKRLADDETTIMKAVHLSGRILSSTDFVKVASCIQMALTLLEQEQTGNGAHHQELLRKLVSSAENRGPISMQALLEQEGLFDIIIQKAPPYTEDENMNIALRICINAGQSRKIDVICTQKGPTNAPEVIDLSRIDDDVAPNGGGGGGASASASANAAPRVPPANPASRSFCNIS